MTVTAKSFREWMEHLGLSGVEAGKVLGRSREAISRFRHSGVPKRDASVVALAMSAYAHNLPPWGGHKTVAPKGKPEEAGAEDR